MISFIENKRNYIMALAVLFVIVSLSGTTYSLFIKSDTTNNFDYTTGLLDLEFIEDEQIVLNSAFPMIDSEGEKQKKYTLVLKNTGNLTYKFDLKMLSSNQENVIDTKYIKVKVNNSLPHTLYETNNIITSNLIIEPQEEITFNINIWLDSDTPNSELGKTFDAKIITTGNSIYKTLDNSGANYPNITNNMLPVYYDDISKNWKKADESNLTKEYQWYDYDNNLWANSIILKDNARYIYDITRNNNLKIDNINYNNQNMIIGDNYLDIGLNDYSDNNISAILKIKTNNLNNDLYLLNNNNIKYYYDYNSKKFIFSTNNNLVSSNTYELRENTWYIFGLTYDTKNLSLYVNGDRILQTNINGSINSNNSFKIGINNENISNYTLGDIYIYNSILSENDIYNNYKDNINIIYNNLVCGYNEFVPMTLNEYYNSRKMGSSIYEEDILSYYVWIPRFKYKLWNVTGEENIDTYDAYNKGIEITFEKNNTSSGVIYCEYNECYSDELLTTKVTQNDNNKYYTHPAFTNDEKEMTGFWISKYEVSENNILENKTNNKIWNNNSLTNFYNEVKNKENNYSIIKNTEWAAVAYLSHSKYGVCKNNTCQKITPNITFISGNELKDSTTSNLTGVFDLAGSASEFTMSKYIDNDTLNNDYDIYYQDKFILGDATKEISIKNGIWYGTNNIFIDEDNNILVRGGNTNQDSANIFSYNSTTNTNNQDITTRLVIK